MHLSFQHTYAGTPSEVVALFRNPEFIADVATHAGAINHDVSVEAGVTRLRMALPTPDNVATFVGRSADITMIFRWEGPSAADAWRGLVDVGVKGLPVKVDARCVLEPVSAGARADYSGDLEVKIPLVGGKVEKMVAPFIAEAFAGIERRAQAWLQQ